VLPFAYVFDLFVDKFSRRRGRRLPFPQIFFCLLDYFLFRHNSSSPSLLIKMLDRDLAARAFSLLRCPVQFSEVRLFLGKSRDPNFL
jgi:hypothetical protein